MEKSSKLANKYKLQNAPQMIMKQIVESLYKLHEGQALERFYAVGKLALASSPFIYLLDYLTNWFDQNAEYVVFVFIAIIIDHLLGSYIHAFVKRDFSLRRNIAGFFAKTLLVVAAAVLIEGMVSILGPTSFVADYFGVVTRLMVFIYPAGSAFMNMAILTEGKFPPVSWMNRIRRFNENLDVNSLAKKPLEKDLPGEDEAA